MSTPSRISPLEAPGDPAIAARWRSWMLHTGVPPLSLWRALLRNPGDPAAVEHGHVGMGD